MIVAQNERTKSQTAGASQVEASSERAHTGARAARELARLPTWTSVWGNRPSIGLFTAQVDPPVLQAKLDVSQPGDPYEQEADRVAEQVMRMPDTSVPVLQRQPT